MIRIFGIAVLSMVLTSLAFADDACRFYSREAQKLGCGSDNYLYRLHDYCQQFEKLEPDFSPESRKVLSEIRACLISSMKQTRGLTCSNVESNSQVSHVNCYVKCGFCGMPEYEKALIFEVVWKEVFERGFFPTMEKLVRACSSELY